MSQKELDQSVEAYAIYSITLSQKETSLMTLIVSIMQIVQTMTLIVVSDQLNLILVMSNAFFYYILARFIYTRQ